MDYLTAIEILDNDTKQLIKNTRQNIQDLCQKFYNLSGDKYYEWRYKATFGYFIAEYVTKLQEISSRSDINNIFLYARRLLEVFITLKYVSQTNAFSKVVEYCERDRYEYLEGWKARQVADIKLFPELVGLYDNLQNQTDEQAKIVRKYGKKPNKMPSMGKMVQSIAYQEEYNYFYKFTSKMLHFCPFTLNGDADYSGRIHKVVFVRRIAKYLEEIEKELENIYQSIPK